MLKVAKKYILAFPLEREKEIISFLKEEGCFEIVRSSQPEEEIEKELQSVEYLLSSIAFSISYLSPFSQKPSFLERIKNPKIKVSKDILKKIQEKENEIEGLVKRVIKIEKRKKILEEMKKEKEEKMQQLKKFGALNFIPQDSFYTFCLIVKFSQKLKEKFSNFLLKNKFYFKIISEQSKNFFALVIGQKEEKEKVLNFLKENKGEIIKYNFSHPPFKEKEIVKEEIFAISKELKNLENELKIKAAKIRDLKIYYDFLNSKKIELEIKKDIIKKNFLNYIVFWGEEKRTKKFAKHLTKISKEILLFEILPERKEQPPVLLENKRLFSPFQYVTEIFGLPKPNEIDPTPYLAFFFILFFGICITDAGYGLILAGLSAAVLLFLGKILEDTKLIRLLLYGGVVTFLVGVLFGSYFGASPKDLHLKSLGRLKMLDPIEDTVLFMGITFLLGYLQITFSQIVKIILAKRQKNKKGIFQGISWILFYFSLALFFLSIKFDVLKRIGFYATLISLVILILAESQKQKIILRPLIGGIKVLQGMIGTMSDILSYSRLMALGLATAVIALIVNQIAFLFKDMIPYIGWGIAVLILVGGHIFNLGINALSGFIHSGRLQFVEFFPKFLEGGGRRFNPKKINLKYIKVENNLK